MNLLIKKVVFHQGKFVLVIADATHHYTFATLSQSMGARHGRRLVAGDLVSAQVQLTVS